MNIKGCEKLTDANVMIVYKLSIPNPSTKTRFHDELYGRHNDGILFKIPHTKLAKGVIEIPQRNLDEISRIFDKYGVDYKLRITIPVKEHDQIVKIVRTIEDPYEKALELNPLDFSEFVTKRLEEIDTKPMQPSEFADEMLAISDTVQKWVSKHEDDPLAEILAYMFKALQTKQSQESDAIKRNFRRIAESLKNWIVGFQVLRESKDKEPIGEVLKKYKNSKK
jgi:hypothetical protein